MDGVQLQKMDREQISEKAWIMKIPVSVLENQSYSTAGAEGNKWISPAQNVSQMGFATSLLLQLQVQRYAIELPDGWNMLTRLIFHPHASSTLALWMCS